MGTTPQVRSFGRVTVQYNTPDIEIRNSQYALKGAAIAASNDTVAAARVLENSPAYRRGFDVATGLTQGMSLPGPGQSAVRQSLTMTASMSASDVENITRGFDVGQALQHGITKSGGLDVPGNPKEAVGFLVTTGIAGSGTSEEIKGSTMQTLSKNTATSKGATKAIDVHSNIFRRILAFFGIV